jgi:2-polyprenyl-6-methoxyphenol hydroxylase-like FAD-dependent oxidoreductase
VAINRGTYWQLAYVIPKGGFDELKSAGIEVLRSTIGRLLPYLRDRVDRLGGFDDVSVLRVALNRISRWHLPGLLLIGDAAHAMSPVFGVGINLAVQDAVATANIVGPALLRGDAPESLLARVARRRKIPTVITQTAQRAVQNRLIRPTLNARPVSLPRDVSRLPVLNRLVRRFIGLGVLPEHVRLSPTGGQK